MNTKPYEEWSNRCHNRCTEFLGAFEYTNHDVEAWVARGYKRCSMCDVLIKVDDKVWMCPCCHHKLSVQQKSGRNWWKVVKAY